MSVIQVTRSSEYFAPQRLPRQATLFDAGAASKVRESTEVLPELNTPLILTPTETPDMEFGGVLQMPNQHVDGMTYGALGRSIDRPWMAQYWAGAADDRVSSRMEHNLAGDTAAERFAGLGAAVLDRVYRQPVNFEQTAVSITGLGPKAQIPFDISHAVDALYGSPAERIELSIQTRAGATVNITLTGQHDLLQDGLAVQVQVNGALSQDERNAIKQMAEGFEKAIQGLLSGGSKIQLSDFTAFDHQVISSIDLKADVYQTSAPRDSPILREKKLSATFHADVKRSEIALLGPEGEARIAIDLTKPALWGSAQQKMNALDKLLSQIDQSAKRGGVSGNLMQMFKSAMVAMHNSYGTRSTDAKSEVKDTKPEPIDLNVQADAWTDTDIGMLSGLADFSSKVEATSKAANPNFVEKIERFSYTVEQNTRITGNDASDRGVTQTQRAHLSATYRRATLPENVAQIKDVNQWLYYNETKVEDESETEVAIQYQNSSLVRANLKHTEDNFSQVKRYEMLKLVAESKVPTKVYWHVDLLPQIAQLQGTAYVEHRQATPVKAH